jgi:precorrin-6B methylase 2
MQREGGLAGGTQRLLWKSGVGEVGGSDIRGRSLHRCLLSVLVALGAAGVSTADPPAPALTTAPAADHGLYSWRARHDPDGIGKFYMGREIAQVMGHLGAGWLERPEREREEQPQKLMEALQLQAGDVVADIGAGTGYFTLRLAPAVAPNGRVKAIDIQQEMLDLLEDRLARERLDNVDLILGEVADPRLEPGSVDLALMVDVYHEFEYPYEMMQHIVRALKPGGRVVLVEYRLEDPTVPIKRLHKMSASQAAREMRVVGLSHCRTVGTLPRQHILIFARSGECPDRQRPASQPADD